MKAANFTLPSTNKKNFTLKESLGKYVVLYFYPKDDTPGCTLESKDFNKLNNIFKKKNALVFGLSKDNIESHLKFKKKYKIKFDLLSDEKLSVIKKYNAWGKKSFLGKSFKGIIRSTFIINEKGIVTFIFDKVKTKEHSNQILDVI